MKFLHSDEPIIACSTSQLGNAAIAVLRISGFESLQSFSSFFSLSLEKVQPRMVHLTQLLDEGKKIDEICLTYFPGPKSYNGENILELSIHGNSLHVERVIEIFVKKAGCRLAYPGEFTYRALRNQKLTLSQVEGLDLFLNASTGFALDQGLSLLNGNLHELYQELWEIFLKHKAALELSIDFSEDVGDKAAKDHLNSTLVALANKIETLAKRVSAQEVNLIRPELVIAGLPNAGKSSLFNLLLGEERAIVSQTAGTTRDYLTELVNIEGVKYRLVDTAGVREAENEIEAEGIRRTKHKMGHAFFSLLLINPLESSAELGELLKLPFDLMLFTHADAHSFTEARQRLVDLYPQLGSIGAENLCAVGANFEQNLFNAVNKKYLQYVQTQPLLLDRHKHLILRSKQIVSSYQSLVQHEDDVAILSHELNSLGHCISELIGIISPDQVLNSIFSNFCIGK